MSQAVVRSGFDTYANADHAAREFKGAKYLALESGAAMAYVYFRSPVPAGATVTQATLRVYARGASSGARTLSVHRVSESWKASRLNWNNKPGVVGTPATVGVDVLADKDVIEVDVTDLLQTIASGASNYGFRLSTTAASRHRIYGLDSTDKPTLTVEWSEAPSAPTSLNPSDAVVSATHPTLQFDHTDTLGDTVLAAVQVQIDAMADPAAPDFDSGEVATGAAELDLSGTAFTGFTGTPTMWRARAKDGAGLWSEWSEWSGEVSYVAHGTVTLTNPSGGVVYDVTPPIMWTFSGTQTAWQVLITDPTTGRVLDDSQVRQGTATAYTVRSGVLTGAGPYNVEVRVWDTQPRAATPDAPAYASAAADFTVGKDAAVAGPTGLTASVQPTHPAVTLQWSRSTAPDSWTIYRNGVPVHSGLLPEDTFVSGTTYEFVDWGARPNMSNAYEVRAVVNGRTSSTAATDTVTPHPEGVWIVDPDLDRTVVLWGDEDGTWAMVDDASVYTPIGADVVRIVSGLRGYEGSLSGYLAEGFGRTFAEQEADLYALKSRPTRRVRVIAADENFEAVIGNIRVAPLPTTREGRVMKSASLDFWQVGALPFALS